MQQKINQQSAVVPRPHCKTTAQDWLMVKGQHVMGPSHPASESYSINHYMAPCQSSIPFKDLFLQHSRTNVMVEHITNSVQWLTERHSKG